MKFHLHLCATLCVAVLSCLAGATPTTISCGVFNISFYNNDDSTGNTRSVQDWTGQQINDVIASVNTWSSHIGNTAGRQINLHIVWNELDSSSPHALGGSSSYRIADGTTQWTLAEYIWKAGANADLTSAGYDTLIRYDVTAGGGSWNFGSDAPAEDQMDFRTVVTHELGHALGFKSSYDYSFDDWGWMPGQGYKGITAWDRNLKDSQGNKPQNGSTGTPGNFNERDNPVYWDGAAASALYGGSLPIYAPYPWKGGSSLSHLDEGQFGDMLMTPFFYEGQMTREVSELEWAMMADMGWTIVPEPATIALLGLGGMILLKRKSV